MNIKKNPLLDRGKEKYLITFILGFMCLFLALLPVMIADNGYFIYYGDFNSQQIPFYTLANNAVRSGSLGWNWFTDLGSDFMGSYAFYLLGSPFFWLTVLLPKSLITHSMPILLCLKHGIAAVTAYAYIRRFVRSKNAAVVGAVLYAFSGFQIYNIFFNHFQDVTAFFPLMLIALEERINNNRRGIFAAAVAFMAILNYFFFTGQVVFLIIYFLLRMHCPDFKITRRKFFGLATEAILGTMIAAFMLLPAALSILSNYRVNERLYGLDMVFYGDRTRIGHIIQSFFMPQDVPARTNLFSSNNAKWSSIGGFLPLFSMVGVISFIKTKRKSWASRLILVCIICAFIPILNCSFYMLNSSYYARWYYMPILIMSMMTAYALDNEDIDLMSGIKICSAFLAGFLIISLFPKKVENKVVYFSFANDMFYFYITLLIAMVCLCIVYYLRNKKKHGLPIMQTSVILTTVVAFICTFSNIIYVANSPADAKVIINSAINGKDDVAEKVSENNFFRVDMAENFDNFPMSWGLPSMRAFQSVVSPSIMSFYENVGVQRDVASRPDLTHYTLRGLFSVKYYYDYKANRDAYDASSLMKARLNKESSLNNLTSKLNSTADVTPKYSIEKKLPGFKYIESNQYFDIYENTLYIPMGFAYNEYITNKDAKVKSESARERVLMKALVLSDKQAEKYKNFMTPLSSSESAAINTDSYKDLCREKQSEASSSFEYDSYGFKSKISLRQPGLVFFSVPYSSGWSATVNGKPADVEKVSFGFMAVKANQGENSIVFSYRTPGLYEGAAISCGGILLLAAYLFITRKNKNDTSGHTHYYDYCSTEKISAANAYQNNLMGGLWED